MSQTLEEYIQVEIKEKLAWLPTTRVPWYSKAWPKWKNQKFVFEFDPLNKVR
jgi:hypothetical protein